MQRARKRLTRKEIKQDEFLIWALKVWGYIQKEYVKLLAVTAAVLVVILIATLFQQRSETQAKEVIDAFGEVRIALYQGKTGEAILQAESIAAEYKGNPEAGHATIILGNLYFELGRFPEAQVAYDTYLDAYGDGAALGYGATSGVAACLEEREDYSGAITRYVAYADAYQSSPYAPLALRHAARCSGLAGDLEKQALLLKRITKTYSNTSHARTAKLELEMLSL